ncbi:MAG: hypothetical protein J5I90_09795 [Caldilineales bacterium]|nr:hypothetical protein [Caldilineales bacterium]
MTSSTSVDDLLRAYPPPIRETVASLQAVLAQTATEATWRVNTGWKSINYRHPRLGYFCGIFPFVDSGQLVFEFGVLLPDPDAELLGAGKQVRYLTFHNPGDVIEEPIVRFVQAALELPEEASVRRALAAAGAKPA